MSIPNVSRRSLLSIFQFSGANTPENFTGPSLIKGQSRRTFLKQTGAVAAIPLLPGGTGAAIVQKGMQYVAVASSNPIINTALNAVGINLSGLTANLSNGASLLSNCSAIGSAQGTALVSSYLNNTLSESTGMDPETVKNLCYFFNPSQEVTDSIPMNERDSEERYENGMRASYETARNNREAFRNDPGVLDFICRGEYSSDKLTEHSPEEVANMLFNDLKNQIPSLYNALLNVSRAADTAVRTFSRSTSVKQVSQQVGNKCTTLRRPNGIKDTHTSQNLHIENQIKRMPEAEKDKYDLSKRQTVSEEAPKQTSPSYTLAKIYHFPELEELRRILESMPDVKKQINGPEEPINLLLTKSEFL